jgi:hypothetical protein
MEMTKKLLVALAFAVMALFSTNSFGQACSSGVAAQFVAAGSSAQFNSFAYAANVGLALPNFWSTTSGQLQDTRFSPAAIDSGLTVFVAWDNNSVCNAYIYFNTDSGIGTKNFFAYAKATIGTTFRSYGAVYGCDCGTGWENAAGASAVVGITDTGALPSNLASFLVTSPAPSSLTATPQPGCGQAGTLGTTTSFCFFNAGMTDIRPEDALYATARALSSYSTTNGLAGLGYNQTGCGAAATTPVEQGCLIHDAFGQGKQFNVLNFKLSGTDPVTAATIPVYTTLSTGASPVIVLVGNQDTAALGFGSVSGGKYVYNNINRTTLSGVFSGSLVCAGDLLPGVGGHGNGIQAIIREPLSGTYNTFEFGGIRTLNGSAATAVKQSSVATTAWISNDDSGQELDVYDNLPTGPSTNYSSTGTGACAWAAPGSTNGGVTGASACGDPLYNPGPTTAACTGAWKARAIGTGEEIKALRGGYTTATLNATLNEPIGYAFWSYQNTSGIGSSCTTVTNGDDTCTSTAHYLTVDGVDPFFTTPGGASTLAGASAIENPSGGWGIPYCAKIQGKGAFPCQALPFTHMIDGSYPIWSLLRLSSFSNVLQTPTGNQSVFKQVTPGGIINMVAAAETEAQNPSFNFADFVPLLTSVSSSAYVQGAGAVTNTAPVSGKATVTLVQTSANVSDPFVLTWAGSSINIAGDLCTISSVTDTSHLVVNSPCTSSSNTSVALAAHATPVMYLWDAGTYPTGSLNLGVFHAHFAQSTVNPQDGHKGCAGNFTTINITGGKSSAATCLVDLGGDMGGSVFNVQGDVDFNLTVFGGITAGKQPAEIYGLHE